MDCSKGISDTTISNAAQCLTHSVSDSVAAIGNALGNITLGELGLGIAMAVAVAPLVMSAFYPFKFLAMLSNRTFRRHKFKQTEQGNRERDKWIRWMIFAGVLILLLQNRSSAAMIFGLWLLTVAALIIVSGRWWFGDEYTRNGERYYGRSSRLDQKNWKRE